MTRLLVIIGLAAIYLGLSSNLEWGNILVGLVLGAGVSALVRPGPLSLDLRHLLSSLRALFVYVAFLLRDLVVSGVQVARIVLSPRPPIDPGIVTVPPHADDELHQALSAHALTLTPGELVVEMEADGSMHPHCLDVEGAEERIEAEQKVRGDLLITIFK